MEGVTTFCYPCFCKRLSCCWRQCSAIADVSTALVSAVGGYPTSAGKPAAYGILAAFDVPALPGFPSIICKGLFLC